MNNKKPFFLKSEKNESIILTPKTPIKSNPNKHFKFFKLQKSFDILSDDYLECFNDSKCMILENSNKANFEMNNEILNKNYKIINKIGSGDYCDVFLAERITRLEDGLEGYAEGGVEGYAEAGDELRTLPCKHRKELQDDNATCTIQEPCEVLQDDSTTQIIKPPVVTLQNEHNNGHSLDCNTAINVMHEKNAPSLDYNNKKADISGATIFMESENNIAQQNFESTTKLNENPPKSNLVCIKKNQKPFKSEFDRKNKLKEIKILKMIQNNKNILKMNFFWEENDFLFIETEFCEFGTLKDLIHKIYYEKKLKFDFQMICKLMIEISNGLKIMHRNKIVHSDLKPENIYIAKSNAYSEFDNIEELYLNGFYDSFVFKIGDFNISRFENDEIDEDGDKKYMAPEILLNKNNTANDIFSLGLIYLELLTGIVLPNKGSEWAKLRKNNLRNIKNLKKDDKMFLLKMINKDYKLRIDVFGVDNYFKTRLIM